MCENFPFPLEFFWKWLYNMGYLSQNFDVGNFHIYRLFVY
jgi:hypothetical protein